MCAREALVAFFSSFFAFFLRFLVLMDYFCCLMKCRLCGFIVFLIMRYGYIKSALLAVMLLVVALPLSAQDIETPLPQARVFAADGTVEATLAFGEDYTGEAPLKVEFNANAADVQGYSLVCSWEFTREGENSPFLTRYDAVVEYEFCESGTIVVQPKIVYTSTENPEIVYEYTSPDIEPFRIVLAESTLEVPNAFSPNGDGINDYFNVYNVKSIIKFNAAIYNRWGQQLYSWGIDKMNCEECGWDGTYKGTPVKDGVYFVVVTAKGADGRNYEIRRDVNILRGYSEGK